MIIITEKLLTVKGETKGDTDLILVMAALAKEYLATKKSVIDINKLSVRKERVEKFLDVILKEG